MPKTPTFASYNWMRGVADDKAITVVHRLILLRLCIHRDEKTGRCNPGYEMVADELGVERTTVFRAVDAGIRRGWLAPFPGHGGRIKRNFIFTFPPSNSGSSETVKGPTVAPVHANSCRPVAADAAFRVESTA